MNIGQSIRDELEQLAEEKYRAFSSSLTPGVDNILGVRLPLLRKMAIRIAKGDWKVYLAEARTDTFEEVMLQGMVIGYLEEDIELILKLITDFVPLINNWAVCDSFCGGLKIARKQKEQMWEFLQPYLQSDREYEIRFGVVMLLNHYISSEYAPLAFNSFDRIKHEGYYVRMAVAWAIASYFTAFPKLTFEYLRKNELDDFTYNKALQKITESLKIEKDVKNEIRNMKRK